MDTKVVLTPGEKSERITLKPDISNFFIMDWQSENVTWLSVNYIDRENRCGGLCCGNISTTGEPHQLQKHKDYEFVAMQFYNGSQKKVSFIFRQI